MVFRIVGSYTTPTSASMVLSTSASSGFIADLNFYTPTSGVSNLINLIGVSGSAAYTFLSAASTGVTFPLGISTPYLLGDPGLVIASGGVRGLTLNPSLRVYLYDDSSQSLSFNAPSSTSGISFTPTYYFSVISSTGKSSFVCSDSGSSLITTQSGATISLESIYTTLAVNDTGISVLNTTASAVHQFLTQNSNATFSDSTMLLQTNTGGIHFVCPAGHILMGETTSTTSHTKIYYPLVTSVNYSAFTVSTLFIGSIKNGTGVGSALTISSTTGNLSSMNMEAGFFYLSVTIPLTFTTPAIATSYRTIEFNIGNSTTDNVNRYSTIYGDYILVPYNGVTYSVNYTFTTPIYLSSATTVYLNVTQTQATNTSGTLTATRTGISFNAQRIA